MKKIEATFRVVTPMFMSGGDQRRPEFRIPSLLGLLRFWYRATAPQNMQKDIDALRQAEANLFGSTDKGQAQFLAKVNTDGISLFKDDKPKWLKKLGISYLGYGPITHLPKKGNIVRRHIKENSIIKVTFIYRPIVEKPDVNGLKRLS